MELFDLTVKMRLNINITKKIDGNDKWLRFEFC